MKPATIRCESVPAATPAVPKERQEKLDELASLQLDIDLAIARADKHDIEAVQALTETFSDASQKAAREHTKDAAAMAKQWMQTSNELDKVLDRAARHRCNR